MALDGMRHLVTQDASNLFRRFGFLQQASKDDDLTAGKAICIDLFRIHHVDLKVQTFQVRMRFQSCHNLFHGVHNDRIGDFRTFDGP